MKSPVVFDGRNLYEPLRMQRLAPECPQSLAERLGRTRGQREPSAVHRIADQWMAAIREMHTDLVGAARLQFHGQVTVGAERGQPPAPE